MNSTSPFLNLNPISILNLISHHRKDLIIIAIIIATILIIRILVGILKKKFDLSKDVTKTVNSIIILFFVEYIKDKFTGLWILKLLFIFETILLFLIIKTTVINIYIKDYLANRKNKRISHLIVDVIQLIIIIFFIMVFLRNVFNVNLIAILTPSAILTAIIGLSMKDTIGNLMSGIVIQIEKPFALGDWIQIGDMIGQVKEINWRYTKIRTILDVYIIIPNNTISSDNIINYSRPTMEIEVEIYIGVSYDVPPVKVKRAIYEILSKSRYVLQNRERLVLLKEYGDSSILYRIIFGVENYYLKRLAIDEVYSSIWYQFKKYGIEIPFPIRTIVMQDKVEVPDRGEVISALKENDLFREGREDVLDFMARYGNVLGFKEGDCVIKEGERGTTMYIIIDGDFDVIRDGQVLATLGKGDFFGEVALISDTKRNASVIARGDGRVLEIDRMLFQLVLERDRRLRDLVYEKFQERVQREIKGSTKMGREEKTTLFENLKRLCGFK